MTMRERDLQRTVEEMAVVYGWLVFHDNDSRRNRAGLHVQRQGAVLDQCWAWTDQQEREEAS